MTKIHKFGPKDKMSLLIEEEYTLLSVLSRFGISLGFGDKSVAEVCELHKVDTATFLAVVNFLSEDDFVPENSFGKISLHSLISYLQNAHQYFLEFKLPSIRKKLIEATNYSEQDVSFLIMRFFDEYANEVHKHMEYENKTVFKYVETLLAGEKMPNYNIAVFSKRHSPIGLKLAELKNIIIKYYPAKESCNLLNEVLFDIFSCEKDLESHCKVEDYLFVPIITELEKEK
ncbi:hemerythrin domain-containing protein [Coprobacter tertius]|uniref:Hemerythrin domain-containing protein n=1 Tax=Coprobacter tertius TaxID=2944915 RepID=A0ABT1MKS2_9BACT|nr:hemerythrin domain-containing protein [Coprobacter tertius]MCP9612639.1 hemerythrin domain-containing protein [Coprobacter tertius]